MAVVWLDGRLDLDRLLFGSKAVGINAMIGMGLPVPPAFTVTTQACRNYHRAGRHLPAGLMAEIADGIGLLERTTEGRFGSTTCPLRVSVRSGAADSMPGMLATVLDVGAVPTRAWDQLSAAVAAVFDSWWSPPAVTYRHEHGIAEDGGTAVTVQAMVFGDADDDSGTGVMFTRNPLTGQDEPYGEWLSRARGDDLVSGQRTPQSLDVLANRLPEVHAELLAAGRSLESTARWVQDIEFTVERGRLWLLQTRDARCPPAASMRIADALWCAGLINLSEALGRVNAGQAVELRGHRRSTVPRGELLCQGEPACPGVASGVLITDPAQAQDRADAGQDVVLARPYTDPSDVSAIFASRAVLTEVGGATSHAAIVCREIGRPCVVGCGPGSLEGLQGRLVTVDGGSGTVFDGVPLLAQDGDEIDPELALFQVWARTKAATESVAKELGREYPPY